MVECGCERWVMSDGNEDRELVELEARVRVLEQELKEIKELLRRGLLQVVRGVDRLDGNRRTSQ